MKRLLIATVSAALLLLNGCVAVSPSETPKEFMNSSIITSSVKARLAGSAGLETLNLSVETLDGTVLLSGFAQTEEQKKRAAEIAETTQGVKKVINNIVVQ